jgi:Gram-negative bacterial TonB protein C-terminal
MLVRRRVFQLSAAVVGALAASAAVSGLAAQPNADSTVEIHPELVVHRVVVKFAGGRVTVARQRGKQVYVYVRTDSGTFSLVADSGVLARWADSAATLPDPLALGAKAKKPPNVSQLRADGDSGAHMRFVRVATSRGPELSLAAFNGAWGVVEELGPQSAEVLEALRSDTIIVADSGHVAFSLAPKTPPKGPWPYPILPDTGDVLALNVADSTWQHLFKQAREVDRVHPMYPFPLRRAGIGGGATLQFMIDATGRVEMESVQLLADTDPLFALACREILPDMRFIPAEYDGRQVRELVRMPFMFALRR